MVNSERACHQGDSLGKYGLGENSRVRWVSQMEGVVWSVMCALKWGEASWLTSPGVVRMQGAGCLSCLACPGVHGAVSDGLV